MIRIIIVNLEIALKSRFKNAFLKITILATNNKNFIIISSFLRETIALFKNFLNKFLILMSLSIKNLAYIKLLLNSIFKNLTIISRIFFV